MPNPAIAKSHAKASDCPVDCNPPVMSMPPRSASKFGISIPMATKVPMVSHLPAK